jgi:hypothetical protein
MDKSKLTKIYAFAFHPVAWEVIFHWDENLNRNEIITFNIDESDYIDKILEEKIYQYYDFDNKLYNHKFYEEDNIKAYICTIRKEKSTIDKDSIKRYDFISLNYLTIHTHLFEWMKIDIKKIFADKFKEDLLVKALKYAKDEIARLHE